MIYTIPEISINGLGGTLGNPFFGGYIYNLDYQIVVGNEGSSTITVSLVSEDGTYAFSPDDLQLSKTYNVSIGNAINLNMYVKKLRKKYSARGYILELELIDGSFILDKYFVGLHKKHGYASGQLGSPIMAGTYGGNPPCFIICGHEINPCDVNNDGTVNVQDVLDPCNPCSNFQQNQQAQAKLVDCIKQSEHEIFDVKYNFGELISRLSQQGFVLQNAFDPNPNFFSNHVGSLREVLSGWCHDFGWIFFWDNGKIIFKDLRTVPIVNAQIQTFCPNIEDYQEEYTLEGTYNSMLLTNYSRSGFDKDEVCQDARYIVIPPFQPGSFAGTSLEIDDINIQAAGLCHYSEYLRNLYYWFIDNGLAEISNIYPNFEITELGLNILTYPIVVEEAPPGGSFQDKQINPACQIGTKPPFASFRDSPASAPVHADLRFWDAPPSTRGSFLNQQKDLIDKNPDFRERFLRLSNELQWRVAAHLGDYYFFDAYYDPIKDQDAIQEEQQFAAGFLGKFYVHIPEDGDSFFQDYTFVDDNTCGQNILRNNDSIRYDFLGSTGQDSLTYFNNVGTTPEGDTDTVSGLPFAQFLTILRHADPASDPADSVTRPVKMIVVSKGSVGYYPMPINSVADVTEETNVGQNWLINDRNIIGQANTFYPLRIDTNTTAPGENAIRVQLGPAASPTQDTTRIHTFLGFKVPADAFTYTKERVFNPSIKKFPPAFNGKPINLKLDPVTGLPTEQVIYQYPQLLCSQMANLNGFCNKVSFKTPMGTFVYYQPTDSDYAVVLEKSQTAQKEVQKAETVVITGECGTDKNVLSTNVHVHNIKDDDINKFFRIGSSTCAYDINAIMALHNNFAANLAINQDTPLIKKIFTIDGVTIDGATPTIDQGLQGISISAGSEGIKTTYTFGTSHMVEPSEDFLSSGYYNAFIQHVTRANDMNTPPLK